MRRWYLSIIIFTCFLSGCATVRHPVPEDMITKAQIPGMPEIRSFVDIPNPLLQEDIIDSIKQEPAEYFPVSADGIKTYPLLAISGGAANGAYGAGLLKGWSEKGTRPVFKVVTGVSTGAFTAPFAFLGSKHDAEIETYYTTTSTKDVMRSKGIFGMLFSNSFASDKPLVQKIVEYIDKNLLDEVAREHKRGRRLFVGTVNLDAQRFVVWDMGAIACRGDIDLFRKVILASASIPVSFPPVYFHVQAEGNPYDEMHVDGGTVAQVFSIYKLMRHMDGAAKALGIDPKKTKGKWYVIRNGYVYPEYQQIKDTLPSIAGRAIDTIVNAQGVGDTYKIYVYMQKRGDDYNLAYIPADFKPEAKELFDPKEMRRLFDRGYEDALKGDPWHKTPPGMDTNQ